MTGVDVAILGPLVLRHQGRVVELAGPRQRALLATLAIRSNQLVSTDTIIEDVWGDEASDRSGHSLQQLVSSLRKLLAGVADGDATALATRDPGYLLVVDDLDADRFERLAAMGRDEVTEGRLDEALAHWDQALACWRGAVLEDVPESAAIQAAAVRLEERRTAVQEDRVDVLLALDRARDAIPQLDELVGRHPFRERLRAQQMLALYRVGRQTDALAAYREARGALIDGLGIEPSPSLRELEGLILQQSPTLDLGAAAVETPIGATYRADAATTGRLELPDGQVVVLVDGTVTIGRDPTAHVRLVDSRVSRRHAEVVTLGGDSMLVDLGSTNGTFVNGDAVTRAPLADGDVIGFGGVELRYSVASSLTAPDG